MSFFLGLNNSHHHLFSFSLQEGGKKQANPKPPRPSVRVGVRTAGGRRVLPHPAAEPPARNTKEGSPLPKCHCSLISSRALRLVYAESHPASPLTPSRTTLLAARRVCGRSPTRGGHPGGYQEPGPRSWPQRGRGLFTRRPSPPSAARTPPARRARPRLPRLTSLKLCDFLLRFLSENSMVRRAGRAGAAAGRRDGGSGGRGGGGAGSCHPAAGARGPRSVSWIRRGEAQAREKPLEPARGLRPAGPRGRRSPG